MQVCLVFPPLHGQGPSLPPVGLLRVAASLEQRGHEVDALDFVFAVNAGLLAPGPGIYEECAQRILARSPDLVGFHTQCATFPAAIQISRIMKRARPDLVIVFGGPYAHFVGSQTLSLFPEVDYCLGGEGEMTFPALLEATGGNRTIESVGTLWYRNGSIRSTPPAPMIGDLESLPRPAYHLLHPLAEYRQVFDLYYPDEVNRVRCLVDDGRGCAYACSFCTEHIVFERKVRRRSPEDLIEEFRWLNTDYGVEMFELCHDHFTHSTDAVVEFCETMIRAGAKGKWYWMARCRVDRVDKDLLDLMHQAGCVEILYGIESSSVKVRESANKHLRRHDVYEMIRYTCEDLGIKNHLTFITGFPNETPEDLEQTLAAILAVSRFPSSRPFLHLVSALPGTAFLDQVEMQLTFRYVPYFSAGIGFDDGELLPDDERLIREHPGLFASFYNVEPRHLDLDLLFPLHKGYIVLTRYVGDHIAELQRLLRLPLWQLLDCWHQWHTENVGTPYHKMKPQEHVDSYAGFHNDLIGMLEGTAEAADREPVSSSAVSGAS